MGRPGAFQSCVSNSSRRDLAECGPRSEAGSFRPRDSSPESCSNPSLSLTRAASLGRCVPGYLMTPGPLEFTAAGEETPCPPADGGRA